MEFLVKDYIWVDRFCVVDDEDDSELCNIKDPVTGEFYGPFSVDDKGALGLVCGVLNNLCGDIHHLESEVKVRDKLISSDKLKLARSNIHLSGEVVKAKGLYKLACQVCREECEELCDAYPGDEGLGEFMFLRGWK